MMKRYNQYKDSGISWIGQMPEHWGKLRAKNMFERQFRDVHTEDEVITCFRDGQVTLRKKRRTEGFTESLKEIGYQGIRSGDLVIHQMDAFAGSIGVSDSDGKGTPVYICCLPKGNYNVYYYAYLLREMARTGFIKSLYRGIRERSSDFRFETFAVQWLPVLPISEQQTIVTYLDTKVNKIDSYIATAEKKIAALDELKKVTIANAVTHGIHPNVPMKDSGIRWIGQVPEHWEIRKLSQVAFEHYISNKTIHHQNLLSLSYGKIIRKDINTTDGLLPASFDGYQIIEPGNIILRLTDLQNDHRSLRVGLVPEVGIITSAYLCLGVRIMIKSNYLYFQLHSYDIKKLFYSMGDGLRQSLNYEGIRKLFIVVPPLSEQVEIVSYIDHKVAQIDKMRNAELAQIEKLKEYKQRLISDVVTGKVKV